MAEAVVLNRYKGSVGPINIELIELSDPSTSDTVNTRLGANVADTYGADAKMFEVDLHYQVDSFGSYQEFDKT